MLPFLGTLPDWGSGAASQPAGLELFQVERLYRDINRFADRSHTGRINLMLAAPICVCILRSYSPVPNAAVKTFEQFVILRRVEQIGFVQETTAKCAGPRLDR
jgi:hypothetical protein